MMKPRSLSAASIILSVSAVAFANDWKLECGYNTLAAELGTAIPTGAGIAVSHIEADEDPSNPGLQYVPDGGLPEFAGKTITAITPGGSPSNHARYVGWYYYGTNLPSMAYHIMQIDAYEADDWLAAGSIRVVGVAPPKIEARRIQNHSWIGEFTLPDGVTPDDATTADALRRIDLMADQDGVVICAGVNNGGGSPMPKLACSAYNVIAVGLSNGGASYGPTRIEAPGRVKPDIVAAAGAMATSYSTPVVASAAALLLQTADAAGSFDYVNTRDRRSAEALTTKALLMGGASKAAPISGWRKGLATPSTDGTVPLDYRYGAGDMNIYNSYHILVAGRQPAGSGTLVAPTGWDYSTITAGETRYYYFGVPTGQMAQTLSILLTWNRKITAPPDLDRDDDVDGDDLEVFRSCLTGPSQGLIPSGCADVDFDGDGDVDQSDFGVFQVCFSGPDIPADVRCRGGLTPSLANLDLHLYAADGFTLGALRDLSISTLDNVEHIYLENLPAGTWAITVDSDRTWPYAITWDARLAAAGG
jgi:hypothetical protein